MSLHSQSIGPVSIYAAQAKDVSLLTALEQAPTGHPVSPAF